MSLSHLSLKKINKKINIKNIKNINIQPPNNCNTIPDNHIPLWYFESSKTCLIPNIGYNNGKNDDRYSRNSISTLDDIEAITFSFHVEDRNKIRCYMFWDKCYTRFYAQNSIQLFKFIFDKQKYNQFISQKDKCINLIKKLDLAITDKQFATFYTSARKPFYYPISKLVNTL